MPPEDNKLAPPSDLPEILRKARAQTPARLLKGRSGAAYRTSTQLELREAHAAARDAVRAELNLRTDFGEDFVRKWNLIEVSSRAANKDEYLLRPDLGRHLNDASRAEVTRHCTTQQDLQIDLQIMIGDGLSVTAVATQIPRLLPLLCEGARTRGWSIGSIFVIRHCRVGILNQIGELLRPRVAILLIGERPGLATAESLSAYMAYRPKASDTDANRNLISNIHARGVSTEHAAQRILNLAALMMKTHESGYQLREELPTEVAPARLL
ncbi:MAG TPA: ethanolamine ammonia-lyase subunit EutC [Terriglobales bacterium]|jgi:ethanolamine ammonia-lyase small subunit|nr:ethanolamine ammonia-lyase subunit EutC [Terriglobales bacterium]